MPLARKILGLPAWQGLLLSALIAAGQPGCSPSTASQPQASQHVKSASALGASSASQPDEQLRERIDRVIAFTRRRHLSPQVHNAWQVVHGLLAFGRQLSLNDNGKLVGALDYLLQGGELKGWKMLPGEKGLEALLEPGTKSGQGHEDQWLGYLSQCGLAAEETIVVQGQTFYISDLVTQAQWDVREGVEATWTLMALGTFLPLDARWQAKDGSQWSLERIIESEAGQELAGSACGGSHRLYAMAVTLNRYLEEGGELKGGWLAADKKIQEAVEAARRFQQPSGAFSTNYFQRAGTSADVGLRINTTGHALEFLAVALPQERLEEPWVAKAVAYLCGLLEQTQDLPLECGGLYHAAHGLALYRERIYVP
ncbi:MAG: ADP-ribosylation factor-directed GTPase activating protein isoform b [Pirellulales bacterium]